MRVYKFNDPYFQLELSELEEETIHLLSFEGKESVSDIYEYHIRLLATNPELDGKKILNKKATLVLNRGEEKPVKINGIISEFQQGGRTPDYVCYSAVLVPRFWWLTLNWGSRVFQQMDIEKLVTQVLEDAGFTNQDFLFDLKQSYTEFDYIVQYQESDLEFIHRKLEHFGISYYFEFKDDRELVVFTDSNDGFLKPDTEEKINYNPNRDPLVDYDTISEITFHEQLVSGTVRLKDYNCEFPNKNLLVESQLDDTHPGVYYAFGDHFRDTKEGDYLARIRNEEFLARTKLIHGTGDSRLLHAGHIFSMDKHYRKEMNQEYLPVSLELKGNQRSLFGTLDARGTVETTFECTFEAIPNTITFRPARKTRIPRVSGIMTSLLENAEGDEYAYIDDNGNYHMRSAFDLSENGAGKASLPVRLKQSYSGPAYGIHFPNHADSELLWACLDGNVDRPIGLGTVPNPANASPVTSANKRQNVIRTASGNELMMDDTIEKTKISMTTPDGNMVLFDDESDKIEILTTNKHKIVLDDKNKHITFQTTDGHSFSMDDKNTKMAFQSKNGHSFVLNDEDGGESITVGDASGDNTLIIDISNNKLVINTKNGDIDMHAPNGTIDIKANTFNLETTGDTTVKSDANISTESAADFTVKSGGNLTQEATGDLSQKGMNVTSEASMDHKSSGMNISADASMEYKNTGMNVTSEAGVNMQVKGTMITLQSTGPHTIKGTPVMIN